VNRKNFHDPSLPGFLATSDAFASARLTICATAVLMLIGASVTHKVGDLVSISTPKLGRLVNRVTTSDQAAPWTFGISELMTNLAARGLLRQAE
jgi:hypothetical protein